MDIPSKDKRLYSIWSGMKQRCENKNNGRYYNWGARGIRVCEQWHNFANFQEWALDNGYSADLTIDRINGAGDYEPTNCRWATRKVQANNKRTNHLIEIDGEKRTIAEWSEISGVKSVTICYRINKGWPAKDAVFKPATMLTRKVGI